MFRGNGIRAIRNSGFSKRLYHSIDHIKSNQIVNEKSAEAIILNKAMEYVPKYGFEPLCITSAARELQYPDSIHSALTSSPTGNTLEFQLVVHWLKCQRQRFEQEIYNENDPLHSITDHYERLAYLINKRLQYNAPIIHHLSKGISQLVLPYNMSQSLEELHNLSDDIAYYAGDMSNDFAWYSKRLGVSSIYVSSELFMLQDSSDGFSRTKDFVSDKVSKLNDLGNAYTNTEEWGYFNAISLVNLIRSQWTRG